MKVGIDVTALIYHRGVSRYTANLVRALEDRADMRLWLYGSSWRQYLQLNQEIRQLIPKFSQHPKPQIVVQKYPPSVQNLFWNKFGMNKISKVLPEIEVFHSWDWLQPPDTTLPLVSTIHDLAILKFPQTAHSQILSMHQQSWKKLRERQAHLIAVSRSTKNDIINLLEYPPELVHVIYEALPTEILKMSTSISEEQYQVTKDRLHLDKPFILFVGTREPRKNLKRLIQAWSPLSANFELIIAGESGWDDSQSLAEELKKPELRFLGQVTDAELMVLYNEANIFAYPSLYEGFGLPILEAFHYGTPVLTAQNSGMIEVAGNAAELVNPLSVESIRLGLEQLLNESLPEQQRRLQKMIIRLQLFNWERVADDTVKVYRQAIESRS